MFSSKKYAIYDYALGFKVIILLIAIKKELQKPMLAEITVYKKSINQIDVHKFHRVM
jgi:hypothetical protein